MLYKLLVSVIAAALGASSTSGAIIAVSVDMDPSTAGIQPTITVTTGTTFTVDILVSDPAGATPFDTAILQTNFNSAGPVLAPGPTGPLAGAIAGAFATLDVFSGLAAFPGGALTLGPPQSPAPGFTAATSPIGLLSATPFSATPIPVSVYSIDLTAISAGSSLVAPSGSPLGSPALALAGSPVPIVIAAGTVNAIPEPSSFVLVLLLGVATAGFTWRRKRL